ncbi:hypothetical protein H8E52_09390 [bacterium]|nr:hypothetical protein [bacterium]
MKTRTGFLAVLFTVLLAAGLAAAQVDMPYEVPHVPVAATTINQLDETFLVLWHLSPPEDWHLYSDRLNDSGFPPALTLQWPEGWSAGPLQWPMGERHVMKGGILDHVYFESVTLLQEIQVPPNSFADGDVTLSARWDWLVCRDICVPGFTQAEIVFSRSKPSHVDLEKQAKAWRALPHPVPEGRLEFAWTESTVTLLVRDTELMEFHPATDCIRLVDAIVDGAREGDTLTLRVRPGSDISTSLRGVLQLTKPDGSFDNWTVDIPYGG